MGINKRELFFLDYEEILINNPIAIRSIEQLFKEITSCQSSSLLINIGAHNFESIEMLKKLKDTFDLEINQLDHFKKIAFLHPPDFKNKSENEERYNFFSNREEAEKWLTSN